MATFMALLSVGTAHADNNDDNFVAKLKSVGVTGAPADLIRNAHQVCNGLDNGVTPDALTELFVSQMGFAPARAANFVALSAAHYCPKYDNLQFEHPH
ncbi:DUF732 domain-containing protein [Mycolicibacter engbaekii]|uniref:DUF732 domain-containing protein n=1 Tax=Mycolicibacter engbaekii TaxID=188915 RepID=UPI0013FE3AAA|nr:DUF732 domain-containing protein [Mycolicibacter engbaekii]